MSLLFLLPKCVAHSNAVSKHLCQKARISSLKSSSGPERCEWSCNQSVIMVVSYNSLWSFNRLKKIVSKIQKSFCIVFTVLKYPN